MTPALLLNLSDRELISHFDQLNTLEGQIAADKIQQLLDIKRQFEQLEIAFADSCCDLRVVQSQLESANDALVDFAYEQESSAQ